MKKTGELLKQKRASAELSLAEVALATKINPKVLNAIENGDEKNLPAKTFLKGFVRSYALFLKMDVEEVMRLFTEETGGPPPAAVHEAYQKPAEPTQGTPGRRTRAHEESSSTMRTVAVVVIVLLIGLIIGIRELIDKYQKEQVIANEVKVTPLATPPVVPSPAPVKEGESTAQGEATATPATEVKTDAVKADDAKASTDAKVVAEKAAAEKAAAEKVAAEKAATERAAAEKIAADKAAAEKAAAEKLAAEKAAAEKVAAEKAAAEKAAADKAAAEKAKALAEVKPIFGIPPGLAAPKSTPKVAEVKTEAKPADAKPVETKSPDAKPAEVKPVETKSAETKPAETKPTSAVGSVKSEIILEALDSVEVKFKVKGAEKRLSLAPSQVHTIQANEPLTLDVSDGGAVNIIVNGRDRGPAGPLGKAQQVTVP